MSIDMFEKAETLGLDYFDQVVPELRSNKEFKAELDRLFERKKIAILDQVFRKARGGKAVVDISLPSARFLIDAINSGAIYAADISTPSEASESDKKKKAKKLASARKRMGLAE